MSVSWFPGFLINCPVSFALSLIFAPSRFPRNLFRIADHKLGTDIGWPSRADWPTRPADNALATKRTAKS